jgi:hypothetical protein
MSSQQEYQVCPSKEVRAHVRIMPHNEYLDKKIWEILFKNGRNIHDSKKVLYQWTRV